MTGNHILEWNWKRVLRRGKESITMEELKNKLSNVVLASRDDAWIWNPTGGRFSAQSLRSLMIENMANGNNGDNFMWVNWLPIKLNCFVWRMRMDRIPLSNNLSSRGITVNSCVCKLCFKEDENVDHVFFRCDYSLSVWNWLCKWSRLMDTTPINFDTFGVSVNSWIGDGKRKKLLLSLGYAVMWLIWKERNERFFGNKINNPMKLADDIQLYSFNWIKNRGNFKDLVWTDWCGLLVGLFLFFLRVACVFSSGLGFPFPFLAFPLPVLLMVCNFGVCLLLFDCVGVGGGFASGVRFGVASWCLGVFCAAYCFCPSPGLAHHVWLVFPVCWCAPVGLLHGFCFGSKAAVLLSDVLLRFFLSPLWVFCGGVLLFLPCFDVPVLPCSVAVAAWWFFENAGWFLERW
ncbi:hypothetical protein LXL04_029295 [Taraxacum kok-saghyz]